MTSTNGSVPPYSDDGLELPDFLDRRNWRNGLPPPHDVPTVGPMAEALPDVTPGSSRRVMNSSEPSAHAAQEGDQGGVPPLIEVVTATYRSRHIEVVTPARSLASDNWEYRSPVPDDVPRPDLCHPRLGKPNQMWTYRNAAGKILGHVCRFDVPGQRKLILPLTWGSTASSPPNWGWRQFSVPRPLYNADQLATRPNSPVLVVEGEKAADVAARLFPDHVATTSPAGANAAHKADFAPLMGREVVIWPDADQAGAKYASVVAKLALAAGATQVRVVELPDGLPEGWDLADPFPAGWSADQPRSLLSQSAPPAPQTIDADTELDRLAKLSVLEYEREREHAAKRLGIHRIGELDKLVKALRPKKRDARPSGQGKALKLMSPEPWPYPVVGTELLNTIAETIRTYVVLAPEEADAVALWCVHTHAIDAAQQTPRLAITSPEKRCGKTTLLAILSHLVDKPLGAESITAAAMFRVVEMVRPTLLVDEADTFIGGNDELRGIIDSGHRPTGSVVRTVGDDHEPRSFSTYSAMAIARIGKSHGTIADRSIRVSLHRRRREELVRRFRDDRAHALDNLGRQSARWVADHLSVLQNADPEMPSALHDRAADNWRLLLAIADAVGGNWPDRARQTALAMSRAADEFDEGSDRAPGLGVGAVLFGGFCRRVMAPRSAA
jgi:Protein of unknown function (DUF3631)